MVDPQTAEAADLDTVIAGVAYHRKATVTGAVFQVVASTRGLQPEISAAEARASVEPLTRLGQVAVYAPAGIHAQAANDAAALDSRPTTFEGHLARGHALLEASRPHEALAEFDTATSLSPKSQEAWAERAAAEAWLTDRAAFADADKADALGPPSSVAADARAILAQRTGDADGVRTAYKHTLTLDPGDQFALERLIELDITASDFKAAEETLDTLVRKHPDQEGKSHVWRATIVWAAHRDAAAAKAQLAQAPGQTAEELLQRAQGYQKIRDFDHARADADAALRIEPSAKAWLARAAADGGYASEMSAADVDNALKLDPTDQQAEIWKVNAALQHLDYAGGLAQLAHLSKDHPDTEDAFIAVRAMIEGRLNQTDRMDADFERAHQVQGETAAEASTLCSWEVEAKWRPETALADCDKAVQQSPKALGLHLNRLVLLHRLGREAEVSAVLDKVEAEAKDHSGSLNDICYTLGVNELLLDRALADCDTALKSDPNSAATLDSRAFVLMRLHRDADALNAYDAALKLEPKLADSLYGRGLVEARLRRAVDSKRDIDAALKISPNVEDSFNQMGLLRNAVAEAKQGSPTLKDAGK